MGDVRYQPDRSGTQELMRTPTMRGAMEYYAHLGKTFAETIAPDAPPYGEGYVSSFHVESGVEPIRTARGTSRRAVATLSNDSDYAFAVEKDHHVFRRTLDYIEHA